MDLLWMLHVLMRFSSFLHLLSQFYSFVPPLLSLFLTHSYHHIYSDLIFLSVSLPLLFFSSVFLSHRYRLPVSKDGGLCMIEIAVTNGTANRSQKYVSETSSEVNPLLLLILNELHLVYQNLHLLSGHLLGCDHDGLRFEQMVKLKFFTVYLL